MYRVVDFRKFENYYFTGRKTDNFCRGAKKLRKCEGVFGVTCKKGDNLFIARDFVGEMPLYFLISPQNRKIYITNTISDLKLHAEDFAFESVRTVPATYVVKLSLKTGEYSYLKYYKASSVKYSNRLAVVAEETVRRLEEAIRKRLSLTKGRVAVLLSGGTDSFSIAYLLSHYRRDLVAYTLTVDGKGRDLPNARRAADFLKIPLRQVDVTSKQVMNALNKAVELSELYKDYDVFMAVGSYLLAKRLKKDGIGIVYTGDGANELFGDYHPWGGFQMKEHEIMTKRVRQLMVFGRSPKNKFYNKQLGSGLGRSLSRLNKIFFHFGIKVINPYLDRHIVEYLLSLPKSFVVKHTKQELFRSAFKVKLALLPDKIRLQDGTGISGVLFKRKINDEKLRQMFSKIFVDS